MTSRDACYERAIRLLFMPVLAAGLALGCAPAKGGGGGGGSSGSSSQSSSSSNPSGGSTQSGGGNTQSGAGGSTQSGGGSTSSGRGSASLGGSTSSPGGSTSSPGGSTSSSGGKTSSSGGSTSSPGGSTSSSGGSTSPSGGSTSSSGGSTSPSGGSTSAGGSTSSSGNPPGYYMTKDWGVTKVDWHGCVWTGKDSTVSGSDTSVTPVDFTSGTPEGGPYRISGTVFNDNNSVALLGFNINEAVTGKSDQCKYDPTAATKDGPPTVTMPPSGDTGIAVNWSATTLPLTFRIQIQGVKGGSDATDRWCATISDTQGPSFVPFSSFNTQCWPGGSGKAYNNEPIDAVSFLVPGTTTKKSPYDITIVGFAPGTSKTDAPGKAAACGTLSGTIGSTTQLSDSTQAKNASMQRIAVSDTTCKKYIIQNNNWGNQTGTYQALDYVANSFTINVSSGSGGGSNVVSFPSIYIGANGDLSNDTFNTWSDSGLPKQISAIKSAQSTFKWSGGNSGNYNAAYDIWFSKSTPTAGSYNDAISGFIMIWLFKPGASQPIGQSSNTRPTTIGGQQYTVWRGPRNQTASGTDGTGRPVISYVANSTNQNFSADLKAFFDDAVANASSDMSAGSGITQAFSSSWYLTDVFAGFEIWNGSDAKGLKDTFTCVIQ